MLAKQRRELHFRSSVGLMLNENYGYGYMPNTVQCQDFIHIPTNSLPSSVKALEFLEKKLSEPKKERYRSNSLGSDMFQAYRNITEQPVGMVHYDREPYFWPGRDRPLSEQAESVRNNLIRSYDYVFNGGRDLSLITPDYYRDSAATTSTLDYKRAHSNVSSGRVKKSVASYGMPDVDHNQIRERVIASGTNQCLKFDLLAADAPLETGGFKPYSPFTDTSTDFDVKEGKRLKNLVGQTEEIKTPTPLLAPKYSDALNKVLDISSADVKRMAAKHTQQRPADVLKLHGNPEYPSKVMDEKDVPNYVAWAKIYPYCPLTQKEGEEKPVFVPPRGFTPSASSRSPTQVKLKDIKKTKRNIIDGIKLLTNSSRKRQQKLMTNQAIQRNANVIDSEKPNIEIKKNILQGINKAQHPLNNAITTLTGCDATKNENESDDMISIASPTVTAIEAINRSPSVRDNSPTVQAYKSIMFDSSATRKILDHKMRNGDAFYTGKTPTRTPSPGSRLPLPSNRAWVKQYSPAKIQRFLASVGKHNGFQS